jgi:hypothetical protein
LVLTSAAAAPLADLDHWRHSKVGSTVRANEAGWIDKPDHIFSRGEH